MEMIPAKSRCWFFHLWTKWNEPKHYANNTTLAMFQDRICIRCGRVQRRPL